MKRRNVLRLSAFSAFMATEVGIANVAGVPAVADEHDDKVNKSAKNVEEISAKLLAADNKLKATDAELATREQELAAATKSANEAHQEARRLQAEYETAVAQKKEASRNVAKTQAESARVSKTASSMAREHYESGGAGNLALLLQALRSDANSQNMSTADVIMRRQRSTLNRLSSLQSQQQVERDRLSGLERDAARLKLQADAAAKRADAKQKTAQEQTNLVKAKQAQQRKDRQELEAAKAQEEKRLAQAKAERVRFRAELARQARLDKQRAAANAAAKKAQNSSSKPPSQPSRPSTPTLIRPGKFLAAPMPAHMISSGYGMRYHPILGRPLIHTGVDFPFSCGVPLVAAGAGTVVTSAYSGIGGNFVMISHGIIGGAQIATYYGHMSRRVAVPGQRVAAGQVIGYCGTTGDSTGCHLHFGVYRNGYHTNPMPYIY